MTDGSLLESLRVFSARWGGDLELVQGAGGNTSVKLGEVLWVKASGKRLDEAMTSDVFVPAPLEVARAMADGGPAPIITGSALRPSIETSLHALSPHRIVAHLHMTAAIAVAVRSDAREVLAQALDGLAWGFIDYAKPGPALARAVADRLAAGPVDVMVLGNHGIIFGGDDFEAVDAMIGEVRGKLAAPPRVRAPDHSALISLAGRLGLEPARLVQAHQAALDPTSLDFATRGSLYPDHPVFLGRGACVLDPAADRAPVSDSSLFLAPGIGALLAPDLPDAAHEMAACLGLVVSAIPAGAPVRPLTREQEDDLLDWDAEKYRRALAH